MIKELTDTERILRHLEAQLEQATHAYNDGDKREFQLTMAHISMITRGLVRSQVGIWPLFIPNEES